MFWFGFFGLVLFLGLIIRLRIYFVYLKPALCFEAFFSWSFQVPLPIWFFFAMLLSCKVDKEQHKSQHFSLEMRWLPWKCFQLLLVPVKKIIFRLLYYKVKLQCLKLNHIANWFKIKINTFLVKYLLADNHLKFLTEIFVQVLIKYFFSICFCSDGKYFQLTDFTRCVFVVEIILKADCYLHR